MTLDPSILKSGIKKLMDQSPETQIDAGREWADLYNSYAMSAIAGPLAPTALQSSLIAVAAGGSPSFFVGLSSGIQAYWLAAAWVGPGFTGVTTFAAGLDVVLLSAGVAIQTSDSSSGQENVDLLRDAAAQRLASVIDTYTKSIKVTSTNVATGATSIVSLQ